MMTTENSTLYNSLLKKGWKPMPPGLIQGTALNHPRQGCSIKVIFPEGRRPTIDVMGLNKYRRRTSPDTIREAEMFSLACEKWKVTRGMTSVGFNNTLQEILTDVLRVSIRPSRIKLIEKVAREIYKFS